MARVVATIGVFDGVHRGHGALLAEVRRRAREERAASAVVTFDPPPQAVLAPRDEPFEITPWPVKRLLLAEAGIEHVLLIRFTRETAAMKPEDFVERVLLEEFDLAGLVVGYDFRFGCCARGDLALLRDLGCSHRFFVERFEAVRLAGGIVSSSRVREALGRGAVDQAAELLGRPFAIGGEVVGGRGLGRRLSAPTANVIPASEQLLPLAGVYMVRTLLPGGCVRDGLAVVGDSPTLPGGPERRVEVHLLDFEGDLLGQRLEIEFLGRLREFRRFEGVEELRRAIADDVREARRWFGQARNRLVSRTGEC